MIDPLEVFLWAFFAVAGPPMLVYVLVKRVLS